MESITFSLISLTPVTFDLNCDTTSSMNVSRFNFASQLPQSRFYSIISVCLSRDIPYQLTVEDTSFAQTGWLIDSVSTPPTMITLHAYFSYTSASSTARLQCHKCLLCQPECTGSADHHWAMPSSSSSLKPNSSPRVWRTNIHTLNWVLWIRFRYNFPVRILASISLSSFCL